MVTVKNKFMLVSWTQTYGYNRGELLGVYCRDRRLHEFKNLFDLNIYSFHNSSNELVRRFERLNPVKNTEIQIKERVNWTQTISDLKNYLKQIGATHFFYSLDDTFSNDNKDINWVEFIEYIKQFKSNFMISLGTNQDLIDFKVSPNESFNSFNVYHRTTKDFAEITDWPFDDTAYVCTTDLLDVLYDSIYMKMNNIWDAHEYNAQKFKKIVIPRYVTDNVLFKEYHLFGRAIGLKDEFRQELRNKKLL